MKKKPQAGFIIAWDDGNAVFPMRFDPECDGALDSVPGTVAWFPTRQKARSAIKVSEAKARLYSAQGKPVNEDWIPKNRKFIRIIPLEGEV